MSPPPFRSSSSSVRNGTKCNPWALPRDIGQLRGWGGHTAAPWHEIAVDVATSFPPSPAGRRHHRVCTGRKGPPSVPRQGRRVIPIYHHPITRLTHRPSPQLATAPSHLAQKLHRFTCLTLCVRRFPCHKKHQCNQCAFLCLICNLL